MRSVRQKIKRYPAEEMINLIKQQNLLAKFHSYHKKADQNRSYTCFAIMALQVHTIQNYYQLNQFKYGLRRIFDQLRIDIMRMIANLGQYSENSTKYNYIFANIDNLEKSFLFLIQAENIRQICSGAVAIFRNFKPNLHTTFTNTKNSLKQIEKYCKDNRDDLNLNSQQVKEMQTIFEKHLLNIQPAQQKIQKKKILNEVEEVEKIKKNKRTKKKAVPQEKIGQIRDNYEKQLLRLML